MQNDQKLIACFPFGLGVTADSQLIGISRQMAEDFSEILALSDVFIAVPQMLTVRQTETLDIEAGRNLQAMAVFYSLPETEYVIRAAKEIGADFALTGRIVQNEGTLLLGINIMDVHRRILHFCGIEPCVREEFPAAIARLGVRILSHFSEGSETFWQSGVESVLGTNKFIAYANWVSVRELERRSLISGQLPSNDRIAESLVFAIANDPGFDKALRKLTNILQKPVKPSTLKHLTKQLGQWVDRSLPIGLLIVWAYRQLEMVAQADTLLRHLAAQYPTAGIAVDG